MPWIGGPEEKSPMASCVGMVSRRILPEKLSLLFTMWSILMISSRKLKMFFSVDVKANGSVAVGTGGGYLENTSLMYACAIGSNDVGAIEVPVAAHVLLALKDTQTGCANWPWSIPLIPLVGTSAAPLA